MNLLWVSPGDLLEKSWGLSIRYETRDECLEASLRKRGWMVPVTGVKTVPGLLLLDGFRRWAVAKKLGWEKIPFLCLDPSLPDKELFLIAVALQASGGLLDLDRAIAIRKARFDFIFSEREILEFLAPLLKLPPSVKALRDYEAVGSLEPAVHQGIHSGRIPFKAAVELTAWRSEDRKSLLENLLTHCHFNQNEWRILTEFLQDLSKREGKSIPKILEKDAVQKILHKRGWDAKKKGEHLIQRLRVLRFPLLRKREESFEGAVREIGLEPDVTVSPSPSFEADSIQLTLKARSFEHLESILKELEAKKEALRKIFEFREGELSRTNGGRESKVRAVGESEASRLT